MYTYIYIYTYVYIYIYVCTYIHVYSYICIYIYIRTYYIYTYVICSMLLYIYIYCVCFFRMCISIYIYTYRERESKCVLCAWRPFHLQTIDVLGEPLSQLSVFWQHIWGKSHQTFKFLDGIFCDSDIAKIGEYIFYRVCWHGLDAQECTQTS